MAGVFNLSDVLKAGITLKNNAAAGDTQATRAVLELMMQSSDFVWLVDSFMDDLEEVCLDTGSEVDMESTKKWLQQVVGPGGKRLAEIAEAAGKADISMVSVLRALETCGCSRSGGKIFLRFDEVDESEVGS